ncbi:transmembrane protein [Sulfuricella denitrificans skB26]|uniref:Transmembrane protein n=1 Tax=Sulfuricella denitrificans (strain DSM 22764 / NBRC 105220 / skB26) TaxID=1163617 RepID=S6AAV6_SULDS|nr:EI24 domain-containing protein [Sulfuricella denitrificans]BAN36280.1 transmembrane protein [Sulfuricella denitrificans skB26]
MREILNALLKALKSLFQPKMLALVLWPVVLATILWGGLAFFFWSDWVAGLQGLIDHAAVHDFLGRHELSWVARAAATTLAIMVVVPLGVVTALLIAAVVAMPYMVRFVAERDYPGMELKRGGTMMGSIWNGLAGVFVFAVLWLLALPLWLFGPFALIVPVFLSAYLNQRLFRYDALADHASREEYQQVVERAGGRMYVLGGLLGLVQFVPFLNLLLPIYIGLAYIHFCLAELHALRTGIGIEV